MQANMGMAGEFRCVVKRADGSTKIDTGYQKNLILNQGLDFFGGNNGSDMMAYCVIGSGNSQPVYTQNKLDTAITGVSGATFSTKYDYDAAQDGNLYKTNKVCKYSFTGLNNVNVSELGLASIYSNTTTYFLCTRALIKDSQGNPTTITVLSGEVLEIYYKLWAVYDVTDKTGQINVLDGSGASIAFNYVLRLAYVGVKNYYIGDNYSSFGLGAFYRGSSSNSDLILFNDDIGTIQNKPSGSDIGRGDFTKSVYVIGSYKLQITVPLNINTGNGNIRSISLGTSQGFYQMRLGKLADDSPLTKTATQTLTIPFEISWGRYEGAL